MLSRASASSAAAFTPRATLDLPCQEAVDVFLKEIKTPIRRTKLVLSALTGESGVLERLYYKGKNQHGASLFWQRLSEMRRYSRRLQDMDLLALLEAVRASFYSPEPTTSSKRLKGAWTHYPASPYFTFVLGQLRVAILLTKKTLERLSAIYQFTNLVMQNGAFLQLTLAVVAIISRVHQAVTDLRVVLEDFSEKCRNIFQRLYLGMVAPLAAPADIYASNNADAPSSITLEVHPAASEIDLTEDIGLSLDRMEGANAHIGHRTVDNPLALGGSSNDAISREVAFRASGSAVMQDATRQPCLFSSSSVSNSVLVKRKQPKDEDKASVKKAKKAKKRKDEIDDIFGMF
ncbi:hypothetical protein EVG20_g3993 [Dentipellis fragilis]|uniref:Nucleolus and neural progenitor protein-like N-terminal domain-containing protein n=1 Tax=Dentipellis fragilis TaxID=205917 RepID=A0A4Y9YZX1_9AGAM|nr:hypothetical protein EVG20_g3993 [Dentipellis fragilis]